MQNVQILSKPKKAYPYCFAKPCSNVKIPFNPSQKAKDPESYQQLKSAALAGIFGLASLREVGGKIAIWPKV